jgi:inner membrane protein
VTVKGHALLASALVYPLAVTPYVMFSFSEFAIFYTAVLFGSILPDIDEPESYIGRKLFVLSSIFKFVGVKHRTFTHFLITPILIFSSSFIFSGDIAVIIQGIALGVFYHTIGDMITVSGIKGYLYPLWSDKAIVLLPQPFRIRMFTTNRFTGKKTWGKSEQVIILFLLVLNAYFYQDIAILYFDEFKSTYL